MEREKERIVGWVEVGTWKRGAVRMDCCSRREEAIIVSARWNARKKNNGANQHSS